MLTVNGHTIGSRTIYEMQSAVDSRTIIWNRARRGAIAGTKLPVHRRSRLSVSLIFRVLPALDGFVFEEPYKSN